jgi:hypothetical protein
MITEEFINHDDTIIGRGECVALRSAGDIIYALIVAFTAETIEVCFLTELPSIDSSPITDDSFLKLTHIRVFCINKPVLYNNLEVSRIINIMRKLSLVRIRW